MSTFITSPIDAHTSSDEWGPLPQQIARLIPGGLLRDHYRLSRVLGRGAHGVTYLAQHELLRCPRVVKLVPDLVVDQSDAAVQRIRAEARAAYRVRHPGVVRLFDCGAIDGLWYMVMEFVDGADLSRLIESPPSCDELASMALDAAEALDAIHVVGIVHRDIKPANLIRGTDGRLRITDLGVARLISGFHTAPGESGGTFDYAAPEMFEPGAAVDHRADLYGLGATLFHLVTGSLPHSAAGAWGSVLGRHSGPPDWPATSRFAVSPPFQDIILRLLEPEPDQRFASAAALAEALQSCVPRRAAGPSLATRTADFPTARGIAVLSFRNKGDSESDDWLGYALADGLGRGLSLFRGVYVAEPERIREIAGRLSAVEAVAENDALRRAGRMLGAGTLLRGWFRRTGDDLRIVLESVGANEPHVVSELTGPLTDLTHLQNQLLECAARVLALDAATPHPAPVQPTHALDAHQKFVLGKQAYLRGNFVLAIEMAQAALKLDPEYADPLQYAGASHARLGKYDRAEACHRRQEAIAEQRGDIRLAVEARANLGVMYYFQGDYTRAYEYSSRAAETAESIGLTAELANIYNNLGFSLLRMDRIDEAQVAYERAIQTHQSFGALVSLIGPYNGLGNLLLERGRFDEAAGHFRKALLLAEEVGDQINVGVSQMNLGRAAALAGCPEVASLEYSAALATLSATSFYNGLARVYEFMADLNLQVGNYAEAERCADKRIELARCHGNRAIEASAWRQKADVLTRAGNDQGAAVCLPRAAELEGAP